MNPHDPLPPSNDLFTQTQSAPRINLQPWKESRLLCLWVKNLLICQGHLRQFISDIFRLTFYTPLLWANLGFHMPTPKPTNPSTSHFQLLWTCETALNHDRKRSLAFQRHEPKGISRVLLYLVQLMHHLQYFQSLGFQQNVTLTRNLSMYHPHILWHILHTTPGDASDYSYNPWIFRLTGIWNAKWSPCLWPASIKQTSEDKWLPRQSRDPFSERYHSNLKQHKKKEK